MLTQVNDFYSMEDTHACFYGRWSIYWTITTQRQRRHQMQQSLSQDVFFICLSPMCCSRQITWFKKKGKMEHNNNHLLHTHTYLFRLDCPHSYKISNTKLFYNTHLTQFSRECLGDGHIILLDKTIKHCDEKMGIRTLYLSVFKV